MTGAPGGPPEPVGVGFAADEGGRKARPRSDALIAEYNLHTENHLPPGEAGLGKGEGVREPDQYQHFHNKCAEYS